MPSQFQNRIFKSITPKVYIRRKYSSGGGAYSSAEPVFAAPSTAFHDENTPPAVVPGTATKTATKTANPQPTTPAIDLVADVADTVTGAAEDTEVAMEDIYAGPQEESYQTNPAT